MEPLAAFIFTMNSRAKFTVFGNAQKIGDYIRAAAVAAGVAKTWGFLGSFTAKMAGSFETKTYNVFIDTSNPHVSDDWVAQLDSEELVNAMVTPEMNQAVMEGLRRLDEACQRHGMPTQLPALNPPAVEEQHAEELNSDVEMDAAPQQQASPSELGVPPVHSPLDVLAHDALGALASPDTAEPPAKRALAMLQLAAHQDAAALTLVTLMDE